MKYISRILLISSLIIQFHCMEGQVLNEEDIDIYTDIVYSTVDDHELLLDIAVPRYMKSPVPAIVDIPGGGWRKIEKKTQDAVFYARNGFVGISITHRTSDVAVFPAAVHDCKTAIRWVRKNAKKYNIDPDRIGVTGVSSGGHLATLLGTSGNDEYLEGNGEYQEFSSKVQAVVDHFGPIDFLLDYEAETIDSAPSLFIGGSLIQNRDKVRLANPITYIDSADPPIWIGHGEQDGMVKINQSEALFDALKRANVPTEFVRVENADHMYFRSKWDEEINPSVDEILQLTIDWFYMHLGKPDIDSSAIPSRESRTKEVLKNYKLYYRFTLNLPVDSDESYCNGNYFIRCEGKILAQGVISLKDFSVDENRVFQKDITFSSADISDKLLVWNFRGEVYDANSNVLFEPGQLQNEKYNANIEGIGFDLYIGSDKSVRFIKKVYRKD
jgi:acetyl esterase/lipase